MGHWLTGLIGARDSLQRLDAAIGATKYVVLTDDLQFLPLSDDALDGLRGVPDLTERAGPFDYLTSGLIGALSQASRGIRFAYIETRYFGGVGGQGAAFFTDGALIFGPEWDETGSIGAGPINAALRMLGVRTTGPAIDEFDTVGLGRFRSMDAALGAED
jgi:hypothetical protein